MLMPFVNNGRHTLKIQSGIPIPKFGPNKKYPFDQLEPGDSVSFDNTEAFERARRAAQAYGRRHDIQFVARKGIQGDEYVGEGGTIWRELEEFPDVQEFDEETEE
jgi:hypothetical protein